MAATAAITALAALSGCSSKEPEAPANPSGSGPAVQPGSGADSGKKSGFQKPAIDPSK